MSNGARIAVRHSARAKRVRLAIDAAGRVELVVPRGADMPAARQFAEASKAWVAAHASSKRAVADDMEAQSAPDASGCPTRLPLRGAWMDVAACDLIPADARTDSGKLERALRKAARQDALAYIDEIAPALGLRPSAVSIRDQTTLWGSLAASGRMSLTWRLILAPPSVFRYVVAHEMAHLKYRGHGPRFWALVGRLDPAFEVSRAWLRENGDSVRLVLAR